MQACATIVHAAGLCCRCLMHVACDLLRCWYIWVLAVSAKRNSHPEIFGYGRASHPIFNNLGPARAFNVLQVAP